MQTIRRTAKSIALAASLSTALLACRAAPTELVVWLDTDIPQGPTAELTGVRVTVVGPDGRRVLDARPIDFGTDGGVALPADLFAISPRDNDATRVVEIDVDAMHGDRVVFSYVARSHFVAGRRARVRVFLANCCRATTCGEGQTCGLAGCEPSLRDPEVYDGDASAPVFDATTCDIPLSCASGTTRCDPGGPCVDPMTDPAHCGGCEGHVCPGGDDAACVAGACTLHCRTGRRDCDTSAANGCETPVTSDPLNCNGCNVACESGPDSTASCVGGVCVLHCSDGFADCDQLPGNGCEARLDSDADHCGACGNRCPQPAAGAVNAGAACVAGVCTTRCTDVESINCDGDAANGCELVAPSCFAPCMATSCFHVAGCHAVLHATFACNPVPPAISGCDPGYYNCDGDSVWNGCESTTPCASDAGVGDAADAADAGHA